MALELSPMTESDVPDFVRIYIAAFTAGIGSILVPRPVSPERRQKQLDRHLKSMRENPSSKFFKVADRATGEVIACAKWHVYREDRDQGEFESSLGFPEPLPDSNIAAEQALFGWLNECKRELLGTRPHVALDLLVTHPRHHRRGAGAMLVRWGADEADQLGLLVYLEASRMGRPLYERLGFQAVKEKRFDLYQLGGVGSDTNTIMIRQPQSITVGAGEKGRST